PSILLEKAEYFVGDVSGMCGHTEADAVSDLLFIKGGHRPGRMREDYWRLRRFQHLPLRFFASVGQINHPEYLSHTAVPGKLRLSRPYIPIRFISCTISWPLSDRPAPVNDVLCLLIDQIHNAPRKTIFTALTEVAYSLSQLWVRVTYRTPNW